MAKKRRRQPKPTIPLATLLGTAAGMIQPARRIAQGDTDGGMIELVKNYTGYDAGFNEWKFQHLWKGLAPMLGGMAVSMVASSLGVNRRLGKAKIPFLRI